MDLTDEQVERIARALSEPRRLQILKEIGARDEPMPCSDLLELHEVGPATISRHLRELQLAGLIKGTRVGKCMDYELQTDVMKSYLAHIAEELRLSI
jgi:ArsR family transcriptional regulator